jgi:hypothetical protein
MVVKLEGDGFASYAIATQLENNMSVRENSRRILGTAADIACERTEFKVHVGLCDSFEVNFAS